MKKTDSFAVEYTDTYGGEANYSWVRRAVIEVPCLEHFGCKSASDYNEASRRQSRVIMRKAKAAMGLTGRRGTKDDLGEYISFRPYGSCTVMTIDYVEGEA